MGMALRIVGPEGDPRANELANQLEAELGPLLTPIVLPVVLDVLGAADQGPAPTPNETPSLPTLAEAAQRLRIGVTKTKALIAAGRLGSVTLDRRRLVPAAAIDAFIAGLVEHGGERPACRHHEARRGLGGFGHQAAVEARDGAPRAGAAGRADRHEEFRRRHDAVDWVNQMEVDKSRGVAIDPAGGRTTVEQLAALWTASNPGKRESTIGRDLSALNVHILPTIGQRRVQNLRPADVQRLVNGWAEQMAASTVKRTFGTLRALCNYAVASEMIGRSPCRNIHLPKGTARHSRIISEEQLMALHEAMDPRYRLMPWTAVLTGMRWGEVAALRVWQLDLLEKPSWSLRR